MSNQRRTVVISGVTIEWICSAPSEARHPGRATANEQICAQAALANGWTVVGIRQNPTTQKTRWVNGHRTKVAIPADPHLTIWAGSQTPIDATNFDVHGHIYIIYVNGAPSHLAKVSELVLSAQSGVNPEVWDTANNLLNAKIA